MKNLSKITHISLVPQGLNPIQNYSNGFSDVCMRFLINHSEHTYASLQV